MTPEDLGFIQKCLDANVIHSPCLELGAGYEGVTAKDLLTAAGIDYYTTDMYPGPALSFVVDFENESAVREIFNGQRFGSALVLNVLEHCFDPIRVLDNVFSILEPSGTCIIITPTVWPLHDFPMDCLRLLPNFYEQYCQRRKLTLHADFFEYVGREPVRSSVDESGAYKLPLPSNDSMRMLRGRIVHKLFNTPARLMLFPSHVAIGVVIEKH